MPQLIINDVGPRDGLQNQAKHLAPSERIALARSVCMVLYGSEGIEGANVGMSGDEVESVN